MVSKKAQIFVEEFVIGLGFFSGLWFHVGINPETEIIKAIVQILESLNPNSKYLFIFWLLPGVVTLISILTSYICGGILGLIAVLLAFIGGVFLDSTIGLLLLLAGVFLGFIAPYNRGGNA